MTDALAPIPPISGMPAPSPTNIPGAPPDAQGLADRFNRLMLNGPEPAPALPVPGDSPVGRIVESQEKLVRMADQRIQDFIADVPHLSMAEITARSIDMQYAAFRAQSQFTAVTAVASSAKSGLQTLMKNQ